MEDKRLKQTLQGQVAFQGPEKPMPVDQKAKSNDYSAFKSRRGPTARGKTLQKLSSAT